MIPASTTPGYFLSFPEPSLSDIPVVPLSTLPLYSSQSNSTLPHPASKPHTLLPIPLLPSCLQLTHTDPHIHPLLLHTCPPPYSNPTNFSTHPHCPSLNSHPPTSHMAYTQLHLTPPLLLQFHPYLRERSKEGKGPFQDFYKDHLPFLGSLQRSALYTGSFL